MSWNLSFKIHARADGEVPMKVRQRAGREIQAELKRTKNVGFVLEPDEDAPLSGSMQIRMPEGNSEDFRGLVEALQGLARAEPEVLVLAHDEFEFDTECDVLSVDLRRPRDLTVGRASYRAERDEANVNVQRADMSMDHPHVASALLDAITAEGVVAWSGSREDVVAGLLPLIESVESPGGYSTVVRCRRRSSDGSTSCLNSGGRRGSTS